MQEKLAISIHAPPRGATTLPAAICPAASYFNSRPSARGDASPSIRTASRRISIHAPPRGATKKSVAVRNGNKFQFTPLREGRPSPPKPRRCVHTISIHAPPRGATTCLRHKRPYKYNFNSRPSARGDWQSGEKYHRRHHFNSRPSARGDSIEAASVSALK